jgi:hypothetical protein
MVSGSACPHTGQMIVACITGWKSDIGIPNVQEHKTTQESGACHPARRRLGADRTRRTSASLPGLPSEQQAPPINELAAIAIKAILCGAATSAMPVSHAVPIPIPARRMGRAQQAASPKAAPMPVSASKTGAAPVGRLGRSVIGLFYIGLGHRTNDGRSQDRAPLNSS